jgi:hypothetical protein
VLVPFERRGSATGIRRYPLAAHPITAVIPVSFLGSEHVRMTIATLDKVLDERVARVYVIDNGGAPEHVAEAARELAVRVAEQGARLHLIQAPDCNVHQVWNLGWKAALAISATRC